MATGTLKKSLLVGASMATIGLAGLGGVSAVSAATNSDSDSGSSIIDKLATKFGLNKEEVQAVFDEDRSEHQTEMKEKRAEKLAAAVKDGSITQSQADYITKALTEIERLRNTATSDDNSDTNHTAVKEKMNALKTWAEEQDIDLKATGGLGGHGFGGPGARGYKASASPDTNSTNE